jgi:hypothetical protein
LLKQRTTDHHMAAYLFGTLPEIDKFRSTAVYVRQSQTGTDDAHGESRKTQLALQDYAARIHNDGREGGVPLFRDRHGEQVGLFTSLLATMLLSFQENFLKKVSQ